MTFPFSFYLRESTLLHVFFFFITPSILILYLLYNLGEIFLCVYFIIDSFFYCLHLFN